MRLIKNSFRWKLKTNLKLHPTSYAADCLVTDSTPTIFFNNFKNHKNPLNVNSLLRPLIKTITYI